MAGGGGTLGHDLSHPLRGFVFVKCVQVRWGRQRIRGPRLLMLDAGTMTLRSWYGVERGFEFEDLELDVLVRGLCSSKVHAYLSC